MTELPDPESTALATNPQRIELVRALKHVRGAAINGIGIFATSVALAVVAATKHHEVWGIWCLFGGGLGAVIGLGKMVQARGSATVIRRKLRELDRRPQLPEARVIERRD